MGMQVNILTQFARWLDKHEVNGMTPEEKVEAYLEWYLQVNEKAT